MNVKICRLCLSHASPMYSLLDREGIKLCGKIESIAGVSIIPHHGLPVTVCHLCTEKVESFYAFRHQIKRNNVVLKNQSLGETSRDAQEDGNLKSLSVVDKNEWHQVGEEKENGLQSIQMNANNHSKTVEYLEMIVRFDQQQEKAPRIAELLAQSYVQPDDVGTDQTETLYCQICLKQFEPNNTKALELHAKSHLTEKGTVQDDPPFTCELCTKVFKTRYKFVSHQRAHVRVKPFACGNCQCTFGNIDLLTEHAQDCGIGKSFSCEYCGRLFKCQQALSRHKTIHEHANPLTCNLCDKLFANVRTYKEHTRKHTVEKSFICEVCSKSYHTKSHLRKHQGSHGTSHLCFFCGKAFSSNSDLNRHLVYHYRNKQFKCDICEQNFFEYSHLIEHKTTRHANEWSYTCEICGKLFSSLRNLKMHQKQHDSGDLESTTVFSHWTETEVIVSENFDVGMENQNNVDVRQSPDIKADMNELSSQVGATGSEFILIIEPNQSGNSENHMSTIAAEKDVTLFVLAGDKITFDL